MTRTPLLTLVLACVLVTSACTGTPKDVHEALPAPSPSPSPSPTPPPLEPVQGTVTTETLDASRPTALGFADDPPPPDGSVDGAAAAVAAVLDQFLDLAQRGEADLAVLRAMWLAEVDPTAAEVLLSGLTNPDNPVLTAGYEMTVHVEPAPTIASTLATVQRRDGTVVQLELVFDVTGEQPQLQLVGGAEVL